jgi:hypothetical protein
MATKKLAIVERSGLDIDIIIGNDERNIGANINENKNKKPSAN